MVCHSWPLDLGASCVGALIKQVNRFFVEPHQVGDENIDIIDKDDIKHITKVLRLKVGDRIEVSDSSEFEYLVEIISSDESKITGKILDKQAFRGEVATKVTLFQCLPKQGKMETIIQKSVELGVYKIVPVFCSRTVVKDRAGKDKAGSGKVERWNKVSAEAVKQCKRGLIPRVEDPLSLSEMTDLLGGFDLVLFPYENENGVTMKTVLTNMKTVLTDMKTVLTGKKTLLSEKKTLLHNEPIGPNIALIIGPEGGFSDEEASLIKEAGGHSLSLGKTIFRTETAGPAALAMIMYELEQ